MILTITIPVALVLSSLLVMSLMTGIGLATAQTADNSTMGNMTGARNMTAEGTNMTDTNQTGSISQVTGEFEQETEGEGSDLNLETGGEGGQLGFSNDEKGNSNSD
jgi:hypothetical protein